MQPKIRFNGQQGLSFFVTVRQRIDTYFTQASISRHANTAMWLKTVFFLGVFLLLYGLLLSGLPGVWGMLGMAVGLGMFAAFIGFNVSHDAIHGAFSANPKVNRILGMSFYLLGANPYLWNITHNVVHHTYTNIAGHDEDIEIAPGLIRIDEEDKVNRIQRFQHLYGFLLYSLASLSWVFRKDYIKFFQSRIGQRTNIHPRQEYFNLFFYKGLYYVLFLLLPMLVLDIPWWQVIVGFVVMHLTEGFILGLVFQLAHIVEGTGFPVPDTQGNIEETWAVHQLQTTANFAPRSGLAAFLFGGLNHQIEHHLFPKVCHIHYPALSAIVRQTAREFNLPYIENRSFFSALQSHYRMLRKLGRDAYRQMALKPAA
jgi:linoleoyl-CoA desaturase